MSTYEYILLENQNRKLPMDTSEKKKRSRREVKEYTSERAGAEEVWNDMQRERRREQRKQQMLRSRKRRRILTGGAVVLAGVLTVWGIQARKSGEEVYGHIRAQQSEKTAYEDQARQSTGGAAVGATAGEDRLLTLVNKEHALPEDYEIQLYWLQNKSCAVSVDMYDALRDMLTEGSADGREFVVASGYRDAAYQQQLLDEDIEASMAQEGLTWQQAYEKETRETMPPGYSEHETGLAVDIVSLNYQILDELQEDTPENQWLQENCSKYGFILRYPKGKEDITGIDYESWHFRYVGKAAAKEITSRGITLEEYLGEA
ncbi:MAG: M15 family metallopeptidase [Lachnospiraceae bacterium]|nr:M15 family metallopeptidase [Lachnospiraceae bacterium]